MASKLSHTANVLNMLDKLHGYDSDSELSSAGKDIHQINKDQPSDNESSTIQARSPTPPLAVPRKRKHKSEKENGVHPHVLTEFRHTIYDVCNRVFLLFKQLLSAKSLSKDHLQHQHSLGH
jgi:hypothetical protein